MVKEKEAELTAMAEVKAKKEEEERVAREKKQREEA